MSFCNSCGANLTPGTRFCSKCGAAILASTLPPAASASPATPAAPVTPTVPAASTGNSTVKIVLIVVAAVVFLGTLAVASLGFFAWRVARHTRVHQEGDNVKVETPFGTVETTHDPAEAARNLGVDLYPGAQILKEGSSSGSFRGLRTSTLNSETSDSVDSVCNFYKQKFPNARVMTQQSNQCTIISNDKKGMITINVTSEDGKTRILISNVSQASDSSSH